MIDYELAKQLKDAGFPQGHIASHTSEGDYIPDSERWYQPTLSELIEACGEEFYSLHKNRKDDWTTASDSDQWDTKIAHGSSPEEAVAKLWLELNKK